MARTGRRPGESTTRQAILDAAREQFGARGFQATTIRGVAAQAGVDPALVMHFFGSKDRLLAACVSWPFNPAEEVPRLIAGEREGVGRRLAEMFVETWDDEQGRNTIVTLLRAAMSEPSAQRLMREFLTNELFDPLARGMGLDNSRLRTNLVMAQLIGVGIARYVLHLEPLASLSAEQTIACLAPAVQNHLTGPLPSLVDG